MSSNPSPKSNGTSFPDSNIPRPSEDTDMQSVPEITISNPAGVETPMNSPTPLFPPGIESFVQRGAIERAKKSYLAELRSARATNTTVNSTDLPASPNSPRRRQLRDNEALLFLGTGRSISPGGTMSIRRPTLGEQTRAVAIPGMDFQLLDDDMDTELPTIPEVVHAVEGHDSSSRVRAIRRPRRHRRPGNHSRRQVITRRNRTSQRNAMDAVSGRPVLTSILNRESTNTLSSIWPPSNQDADADDEAVNLDSPLPDPAMNLDTFTARRNVRSRSALSNVMSTSDMEYEHQEMLSTNTDLSYSSETLLGNLQAGDYEVPTDQREKSALDTFTTPVNTDSPSVASTSTPTSLSSSTTEPQFRSQAIGTGNTTVSSRKLSQDASVRLWKAMYRTNDKKQQDLETMREEGVDDIPIAKLSIGGSFRR
ncbi:uncharacterized protein EAE97_004191 [Botrytis byssoidea]|uniref:Uncharacterized protein n=1 Tax=Botrytis byssoidea TaxID=139641 RepID=A0A9P5IM66_9HELO|nr:uncharacterized protein EAE97_004191 [Botrytis byssoidea]KAF7946942.1 hypothetical protein EAE97_004191 [Botrytis byssoidea]